MKRTHRRSGFFTAVLTILLVTVAWGTLVTAAVAAPPGPVMGLNELRMRLLQAGPSGIAGHFDTVLRGDTISSIPVRVIAVTGGPTDVLDPAQTLIYFEAYGPDIDRIGGIAQGMSGSPVFVSVNGSDWLIGALAYGDMFSRNGAGLATPIEAMTRVESEYRPTSLSFAGPVMTGSGIKERVVIMDSDGTAPHDAETIVARPLTALFVSQTAPRSTLYQRLKRAIEAEGYSVLPFAADLGTGGERFTTTLRGGSSLAVLLTRGDLWFGALGTVTYVDDSNVMGFGHPLTGAGATDFYMSNAWVDGVWGSSAVPYKFGVPGALRGTLLSDRPAGVFGKIGPMPQEAVVRARARRTDTGASATSAVAITDKTINSAMMFGQSLPAYAAATAGYRLIDTWPAPGSAITTTTVRLTDGETDYTVVLRNRYDSTDDIVAATANDVVRIVGQLQLVNDTGIHRARITSIDLESELSPSRNTAHVVGVSVPGGLKHGDNLVRVSLLQKGVAATRTVDVTVTVPDDVSLKGQLVARSQQTPPSSGEQPPTSTQPEDRRPTDIVVAALNQLVPNDVLTVEYFALEGDAVSPKPGPAGPPAASASATITTPWALTGSVFRMSEPLLVEIPQTTIAYRGTVPVNGTVSGVYDGVAEVWVRPYGEVNETLVATAALEPGMAGGTFTAYISGLTRNSRLRIVAPGGTDVVESQATALVRVRASVGLTASTDRPTAGTSVRLRANVAPTSVSGPVIFERRVGRTWRTIGVARLSSGSATLAFAPPAGSTVVRARVSGRPSNAAGVSRTITLVTR